MLKKVRNLDKGNKTEGVFITCTNSIQTIMRKEKVEDSIIIVNKELKIVQILKSLYVRCNNIDKGMVVKEGNDGDRV